MSLCPFLSEPILHPNMDTFGTDSTWTLRFGDSDRKKGKAERRSSELSGVKPKGGLATYLVDVCSSQLPGEAGAFWELQSVSEPRGTDPPHLASSNNCSQGKVYLQTAQPGHPCADGSGH